MARYTVSVGGAEYRVEVNQTGLLVNDEPVTFEFASLNGNGLHLFRRESRSTEMYFQITDHADYEVVVNGHRIVARVDCADTEPWTRQRLRGPKDAAFADTGGDVRAPMPGLIVEVCVDLGQEVEEGQTLLTQESMKMQMQLRAPCAGRVIAMHVSAGDQVGKDAPLVRVACDDASALSAGTSRYASPVRR
ncbi:MAG: acetyl-CoA carboxylase biotin carboxyl carrier protein subunit [Anaerolineae bacterium]|nr:acetyl-CoA carboxylase biotin carboxyl carrier protein subunit [Anaerolineae bacterium]